jgi:hypothetical protein
VFVVRDQFLLPFIRGSRLVRPPSRAWPGRESTRRRRSIRSSTHPSTLRARAAGSHMESDSGSGRGLCCGAGARRHIAGCVVV